MNGKTQENNKKLDVDQIRVFWSSTWSESKEHKRNPESLKKMKEEKNYHKQERLVKEMVFE